MPISCPQCQRPVDPQAGHDASPAPCPHCGASLAVGAPAGGGSPSLAVFLHPAAASPAQPDAAPGLADLPPAQVDVTPRDLPQAAPQVDDTPPGEDNVQADAGAAANAVVAPEPAPVPARKATAPRFLHPARTTPVRVRRARRQWVAVIALSLLLCVQVVLADRARLATQAAWRPMVVALCAVFRCEVPTWREPAAFTMLSRDVRPILGQPGTLQAQATFRNDARWAQAWPVILLTLKDADGRTLGARALQPGDYLPQDERPAPIGPGQSAQMAVRIREPSANVVAFSFDFR
ncbi:DUF3426 domain-containing protein [Pseudoxanthomonas sp. F37]|uniref:DUF3426 domain-containing protein n=1 Tax=Pseudoxanthomonas TaxID=83618 RepID=UPI001FD2E35B|nr:MULTISPECIES: DUF3426 domain-containing protein [Pseudoxanthomonas]UOV04271.1 DUF3426 domain-containing protein [Pseudoxanthomonas mexicana]UOV09267.1 DUF3426 domain-containing protein [Pseudoxanthomonas sp. F37]